MRTAIVNRPLEPAALLAEVASTGHGATALFVGTVRDINDSRGVTALEYSAYGAMAERELEGIAREAEAAWPPASVVCEHRIGTLALGDASVVIAVSHPHRAPAFDACRFVIEQLKARLPIWKREHYADGERSWVENRTPLAAGAPA